MTTATFKTTAIETTETYDAQENLIERFCRIQKCWDVTDAPDYDYLPGCGSMRPDKVMVTRETHQDGYEQVSVQIGGYALTKSGRIHQGKHRNYVHFSGSNSAVRKGENFENMPSWTREIVSDHIILPATKVAV